MLYRQRLIIIFDCKTLGKPMNVSVTFKRFNDFGQQTWVFFPFRQMKIYYMCCSTWQILQRSRNLNIIRGSLKHTNNYSIVLWHPEHTCIVKYFVMTFLLLMDVREILLLYARICPECRIFIWHLSQGFWSLQRPYAPGRKMHLQNISLRDLVTPISPPFYLTYLYSSLVTM